MKQNKSSLKMNKGLKYLKTFESFGKNNHQLITEEESFLSKTLATLALIAPFFGLSKADAGTMELVDENPIENSVTFVNQEKDVELKKVSLSDADTSKIKKTFINVTSAPKKFNLEIVGFKKENVVIKEVQMEKDLFEKEVIACFFTTSELEDTEKFHGGTPKEGVKPKFIVDTLKDGTVYITLVNNGIEPEKIVVQVSVEKSDIYNHKGELVRAKTQWTINGEKFEDLPIEQNNPSSRILD